MRPTNSRHTEHAQMAADVDAFLRAGGKIQKIPRGLGKNTAEAFGGPITFTRKRNVVTRTDS